MKKAIIIIGKNGSGKTRMAKEIASCYCQLDVLFKAGKDFSLTESFPFAGAHEGTELIIIDDIQKNFSIDVITYLVASQSFPINVKNQMPINIFPQFVFTCQEDITMEILENQDPSFRRRIQIIQI